MTTVLSQENPYRFYEVVFLVHPDHSDQVKSMVEGYQKMVFSTGGSVSRVEDWGRRQLAYPIHKVHKAHYVLMNIQTTADGIQELRLKLEQSDFVLRNLILQMNSAVSEPSLLMNPDEAYDVSLED